MIQLDDLIGVPYKVHGRDLSGLDCYGLAIIVLKRAAINLPDYLYESTDRMEALRVYEIAIKGIKSIKLENPELYCIVMLRIHGEPQHCAVYIGNGRIIHAMKSGVIIENLKRWENRIDGYYKIDC